MKILVALFSLVFAFLLADFIWSQKAVKERSGVAEFSSADNAVVPFNHMLHGDSIGMDCAACHTGARSAARAYMPSKADCMDCHRLPLTENPGIEKLDSVLKAAPENPWKHRRMLPEHVVFHHGVHAAAGVSCADCHGSGANLKNIYGGEKFDMKTCLQCHKGEYFRDRNFKPAATYCAACHR